ncbi:MAG: hypothetical protein OEY03_02040 [Rhizobacter sp.]|nr:hypothetical protein [Rhizobacter sp.]
MPLNAFIVRPFNVKELHTGSRELVEILKGRFAQSDKDSLVVAVQQIGDTENWRIRINFEVVHRLLLAPVLEELRIKGETASAVVVAGNIREDMFNRLVTADLVIADLSIHNPNVFYELGVRQAFRDKYTFVIRSDLSDYPFDLKTDRYFEYNLIELVDDVQSVRRRLAHALRSTLNSTDADSPIFKLLPQLEAEDRARFIAVPEDFREEVEWARHQRRGEHLSLMAVECDGYLWEVEGLRVIGRAQFEANFISGAKSTWEQIVNRYPDDVEANSVLSTIYQRVSDMKRSEQALSRVARTRSLSQSRLSELRSLAGRNLKAAWIQQWRKGKNAKEQQRAALVSPLLQRAFDAFHEAFKTDLNNSYAGLNALTMLVIQTELAQRFPTEWKGIQRRQFDAAGELSERKERIRKLIAGLELAVESDRERLQLQGHVDPWFSLLEAAVACLVSDQPEYVVQLYEQAVHFAPESAEESIRGSLEVYVDLGIGAPEHDKLLEIGTVGVNVRRAMDVLSSKRDAHAPSKDPQRILMFAGMRVDPTPNHRIAALAGGVSSTPVFPPSSVENARLSIEAAIDEEIRKVGNVDRIVFGIAAGASGGDLLFHNACRDRKIPTRLCLALPKPQYVGQFVAPAGNDWVEQFSDTYHHLRSESVSERSGARVREFTDSGELPRWLQSKPYYNVGRRNTLWMLQHAIAAANELGDHTEITLFLLWNENNNERGIGGIGDLKANAVAQGVKVCVIPIPIAAASVPAAEPSSAPMTSAEPQGTVLQVVPAARSKPNPERRHRSVD